MTTVNSPPGMPSTIERAFTKFKNLTISNNMRMISPHEKNDENAEVYEQAAFESFEGRYSSVSRLNVGGLTYTLSSPIKILSGTPPKIRGSKIVEDDDGNYLAQKVGNQIVISLPLTVPMPIIEHILKELGYPMLSDIEYNTNIIKTMFEGGLRTTKNNLDRQIRQYDEAMTNSFNQYTQSLTARTEIMRQKIGTDNSDKNIIDQISSKLERLQRSPYLESIEVKDGSIGILTKPLYLADGLWNIGQYNVMYVPSQELPTITRITAPVIAGVEAGRIIFVDNTETISRSNIVHPHINGSSLCGGNFKDMLMQFWSQDFLTGFNLAVQYIRSYSSPTGPFFKFEIYLKALGYLDDANLLRRIGEVEIVDDGEVKIGGAMRSRKWLEEAGMRGNICTDPQRWENDFLACEKMKRDGMKHSLEFSRWSPQ